MFETIGLFFLCFVMAALVILLAVIVTMDLTSYYVKKGVCDNGCYLLEAIRGPRGDSGWLFGYKPVVVVSPKKIKVVYTKRKSRVNRFRKSFGQWTMYQAKQQS